MLTLLQIFSNLVKHPHGNERVMRTDRVRVTGLQRGVSKSTGRIRFIARTQTPEKRALGYVLEKYTSSIDFLDKEHVIVSCTCPDFMFMWEWALARKKAAQIIFGNGEPPDSKNPRHIAGCCKHLVKMTDRLYQEDFLTADFTLKTGAKHGK